MHVTLHAASTAADVSTAVAYIRLAGLEGLGRGGGGGCATQRDVTGALTGPRGVRGGRVLIPHYVHLRMSARTNILRHISWGKCSFTLMRESLYIHMTCEFPCIQWGELRVRRPFGHLPIDSSMASRPHVRDMLPIITGGWSRTPTRSMHRRRGSPVWATHSTREGCKAACGVGSQVRDAGGARQAVVSSQVGDLTRPLVSLLLPNHPAGYWRAPAVFFH